MTTRRAGGLDAAKLSTKQIVEAAPHVNKADDLQAEERRTDEVEIEGHVGRWQSVSGASNAGST